MRMTAKTKAAGLRVVEDQSFDKPKETKQVEVYLENQSDREVSCQYAGRTFVLPASSKMRIGDLTTPGGDKVNALRLGQKMADDLRFAGVKLVIKPASK